MLPPNGLRVFDLSLSLFIFCAVFLGLVCVHCAYWIAKVLSFSKTFQIVFFFLCVCSRSDMVFNNHWKLQHCYMGTISVAENM